MKFQSNVGAGARYFSVFCVVVISFCMTAQAGSGRFSTDQSDLSDENLEAITVSVDQRGSSEFEFTHSLGKLGALELVRRDAGGTQKLTLLKNVRLKGSEIQLAQAQLHDYPLVAVDILDMSSYRGTKAHKFYSAFVKCTSAAGATIGGIRLAQVAVSMVEAQELIEGSERSVEIIDSLGDSEPGFKRDISLWFPSWMSPLSTIRHRSFWSRVLDLYDSRVDSLAVITDLDQSKLEHYLAKEGFHRPGVWI